MVGVVGWILPLVFTERNEIAIGAILVAQVVDFIMGLIEVVGEIEFSRSRNVGEVAGDATDAQVV